MDNLKTLNDTLGHEAGDVALKLLAGALRSGLRRGDNAYRLGGDEFAVVLPGASRLDAERVTRRLREATAACAAEPVKAIDASFGIAVHEPDETPDQSDGPRRRGALRGQAQARVGGLTAVPGLDPDANMCSCPTSSSTATRPTRSSTGRRIRPSWPGSPPTRATAPSR